MLIFILGSFTFGEITEQEVNSFFSPKTQVYNISNQKDCFFGLSIKTPIIELI